MNVSKELSIKTQSNDDICHVHVIGAGAMGAGIAAQCLLKGLRVSLQDENVAQLGKAVKLISHEINHAYQDDPYLKRQRNDALYPDFKGDQIKNADIVIEAIFENLDAKSILYQSIEPKLKQGALLATNTSSIPLKELATTLKEPNRLIGLHFFNPPTKMQLIEVISEEYTEKAQMKKAFAFVKQIGRLPLPVKSSPGFLVNRLLMPYLLEGMLIVEEGHTPFSIDKLAEHFGMPIGPLALIDQIGLDICLDVAQNLAKHMDKSIPDILFQKVKQGKMGRKTKKGFYAYNKYGKMVHPLFGGRRYGKLPNDTKERLILPIFKEAIDCLKEGVVADGNLLDAGLVFGAGFAPFRGGIIQYAITQGIEKQVSLLRDLEGQYGDRFKVDENWKTILIDAGIKI